MWWLPYETESVTLKAAAEDQRAGVSIDEQVALIPGQGNDILVTVTAENGTQQVYTVTVIRAPKHEDTDRFLYGEPEPTVPTMPETEPTVTPATEPETQPAADPTEPENDAASDVQALPLPVLIVVLLGCALLGAAVGVAATLAAN